ncbi:hypothetical protein [Sinomonas sp. P10A9]|uniref:Uncharacterized protein n=1 Tax=Sinomonas puerhi TaxID=3238584 RepID=A0AB39L0U7_9MICC
MSSPSVKTFEEGAEGPLADAEADTVELGAELPDEQPATASAVIARAAVQAKGPPLARRSPVLGGTWVTQRTPDIAGLL